MRSAFLALVVLGVAGCADKPISTRPAGWDDGVELEAHFTGRSHSGAFTAWVFPDSDLARPVTCKAYRANEEYGGDTCSVMDPSSESWFPIGEPAWGLEGQWRGREADTADTADPDLPRTLVAFDEAGAIAFWAGRMHPQASHATE
ncbi:MAG TPA: hypothetical protein VFH47_04050 [Candidatus Thermoplasmatota archaeon]|nr:hypothetical protein [Candidatus Thermoplasmatota archaeon]